MDFDRLPFDSDQMLEGLRPWVECESPTFDPHAVNQMLHIAAHDMAEMGARIELIPGLAGYGGSVRATFPHPRFGEPGILIAGHMDTVHPVGTLAQLPFYRDGDYCWGPGIQDMKSGNYLSLEAIRQLQAAAIQTPLPITVLFTPDEEIGTPSARGLVEATALQNRYVLVPEPALAGYGATWGRYAIARYNIETVGVPVHAGVDPRLGRSAIKEMARRILEIEAMTTDDCTYSVGVLHAGQWVNCVTSSCHAEVLSMAKKQSDLDAGIARMMALEDLESEVAFKVRRGVTRPVWETDEGSKALYEHALKLAGDLGQPLPVDMTGGGSDGNFTGALGIPTLDSLGAYGGGLHTLNEHIEVESLAMKGKLMAALLATLE